MRKFIYKSLFFICPYILLYLYSVCYYPTDGYDLFRVGYLPNFDKHYQDKFATDFLLPTKYQSIANKPDQKNFDYLTIGDSFSEQGNYGYKNYIAQEKSVLHINRFLSEEDPISNLLGLLKGDFFDNYHFKYVILQSVERNTYNRVEKLDTSLTVTLSSLNDKIDRYGQDKTKLKHTFFSNQSLIFGLNSLMYIIGNKKEYGGTKEGSAAVCLFKLNQPMFSGLYNDRLLAYKDEIKAASRTDQEELTVELNETLNEISNRLQVKGMKLIFLPAVDRFDLYYPYMVEKPEIGRSVLLDELDTLHKNYIYVNSKKILSGMLGQGIQDVFFYNDSHWSPIASKEIANFILELSDSTANHQ